MKLSRFIIGTMRWGIWGENLSGKEMAELIETSLEQGYHSFDLADIYGAYTTEEEFGEGLKLSSINRENVQLISKCGIGYPSENSPYKTKIYDTSYQHIIDSVNKSLKNLQTDYLDYLLIHRPNPLMDFEQIKSAINSLKQEGKILHFGLSNFDTTQLDYVSKFTEVSTHQIEYSLVHNQALFNNTLLQAQVNDFPIMAWSPIGTFYNKNSNEELKISVMAFAQKYKCSENSILLAWIMKNPAEIIPVVGTTKKQRIEELQEVANVQLSDEDWFLLLEKARGKKVD